MNASKLLVKQHRLNANVYLYFLLKPHKAMTVKELRKKKLTRTKRRAQTRKVSFWNMENSANCFSLENTVIRICWSRKPKSQSFPHKTVVIFRDWELKGRCAKYGAGNWTEDWTSLKEKLDFSYSLSTPAPSKKIWGLFLGGFYQIASGFGDSKNSLGWGLSYCAEIRGIMGKYSH